MNDPLVRNGMALVSSAALSSILGFVYWVIAARLYPAAVVGTSGVMISSMITLANLGQLNFGNFMNRTLAGVGPAAGGFIFISYLLAAASSAVFGVVFVLLSHWLAPKLSSTLSSFPLMTGYVLCVMVWTIFNLQDSVLSGLQKSVWVPVENGVFSLAKIVLLVLFAGWHVGMFGPFIAWVLPACMLIPAINYFVATRFVPETRTKPVTQRPTVSQVVGMMSWDYLATIMMMIGLATAPILVLEIGGSRAAAGYSVAWAITYSIYLVARSIGISLMAEAAADPALRRSLAARSLTLVAGLLLSGAVAVIVLAPYILSVFGKDYVGDNVILLRLLVVSTVPWGMTTVYVALARSAGNTGRIAGIQLATIGLFFSVAAIFAPVFGVIGIGLAWLTAHSVVFVGTVIAESRANPGRLTRLLLFCVSSSARLLSSLRGPGRDAVVELNPRQASAVARILTKPLSDLKVRRAATFYNDCETLRIEGMMDASDLYLKRAKVPAGRQALHRHVKTISRLRDDLAATPQSGLLPEILADESNTGDFIIQRAVAGVSGRECLRGRSDGAELLEQAARAMAAIHAAGSREAVIDDEWRLQWIDRPLAKIAQFSALSLNARQVNAALEAIRSHQHRYWSGRRVQLGWHHGDYSPGNIFFVTGNEKGGATHMSAIIDWDGAVDNGPAGVDAWHLALTAESERREEELGFILWDFFCRKQPPLGFLPKCDAPPDILATLAWLRHVEGNLEKSQQYRSNVVWRVINIEWVLHGFLQAKASGRVG